MEQTEGPRKEAGLEISSQSLGQGQGGLVLTDIRELGGLVRRLVVTQMHKLTLADISGGMWVAKKQ